MERRIADSEKGINMIKWRVAIKVAYYEVDWIFDKAEEAVEFAVNAAMGRTENGDPVAVSINGILPEEEVEDE